MRILVIDTIHGGLDIAGYLNARGHFTDVVDVYRGRVGIDSSTAAERSYDLAIAPVHLDPHHPLLQSLTIPVISHHDVVRWIIGEERPAPFIEITGARGKTTTACALAHVMKAGYPPHFHRNLPFPEKDLLWKKSSYPLPCPGRRGAAYRGWCISEVSLGCTGAGYGIITSSRITSSPAEKELTENCSGQRLPPSGSPGIDAPCSAGESVTATDVYGVPV